MQMLINKGIVIVTFFSFISTEREESNLVTIGVQAKEWALLTIRDAILHENKFSAKEGKKRSHSFLLLLF